MLKNKNKDGTLVLPNFKAYYRAIPSESIGLRRTKQIYEIEHRDPEKCTCMANLFLAKMSGQFTEERTLFNNSCGKTI